METFSTAAVAKEIAARSKDTKGPLTYKQAQFALNTLSELIVETLADGDAVSLKIGKFKPVDRAARPGRNPKTGEALTIQKSRSCSFKASLPTKQALLASVRG